MWADPRRAHRRVDALYTANRPGCASARSRTFAARAERRDRHHRGLRPHAAPHARNVAAALVAIGQGRGRARPSRRLNTPTASCRRQPRGRTTSSAAPSAPRGGALRPALERFDEPTHVAIFAGLLVAVVVLGAGALRRWPRADGAAWAVLAFALAWGGTRRGLPPGFREGLGAHRGLLKGMYPPDKSVAAEVLGGDDPDDPPRPRGDGGGRPLRAAAGPAAENVNPGRLAAARGALRQPSTARSTCSSSAHPGERVRPGRSGVGALAIHTVGSLGKQSHGDARDDGPGARRGDVERRRDALAGGPLGIWPQFTRTSCRCRSSASSSTSAARWCSASSARRASASCSRRTCAAPSTGRSPW